MLKLKPMTQQAKNSIELYRGNNPSKILQLLRFQSPNVVNELKEHFGIQSLDALAVRLSSL
jgi:hypothetical protein